MFYVTILYYFTAITGERHCSDLERSILSLPTRYDGLNIGIPGDEAIHEYENSISYIRLDKRNY